jgi:ribulose-bisphosphate carboxylase large chain
MRTDDVAGFFGGAELLESGDYLALDYAFECTSDPREAAAHLCSEQSTAQWRRVGVDEDLRARFAAKVVDLQVEPGTRPQSYAGPDAAPVHVCRATLAHPHGNFGPRIPNLLSAVCGEGVFFVPGIPVIKLLDIRFPAGYLAQFEGPRFGAAGFRERAGAEGRPVFFGVIKPNIGLPPEPFAEMGLEAWLGGLDVAKDDEMLADPAWSPLAERSRLLGDARRRAEDATGEGKVYLANITDEVARLRELHDMAVANGANALMVNALPVGLSGIRMLRAHSSVPLVGHFPLIAASSRLPAFGIHARVYQALQRLAGLDVIIMPGFGPRMRTPDDEVHACIDACRGPMGPIAPSLPVPGGSDSAATLEGVYRKVGNADFGFVPGRGVFGHPMGPRAGARSVRQAWEALAAGVPVREHAAAHPELAAALEAFGEGPP